MFNNNFSTDFLNQFESAAQVINEWFLEGNNLAKKNFNDFLNTKHTTPSFKKFANIDAHHLISKRINPSFESVQDVNDYLSIGYCEIEDGKYLVTPTLSFINDEYLNGQYFSIPIHPKTTPNNPTRRPRASARGGESHLTSG